MSWQHPPSLPLSGLSSSPDSSMKTARASNPPCLFLPVEPKMDCSLGSEMSICISQVASRVFLSTTEFWVQPKYSKVIETSDYLVTFGFKSWLPIYQFCDLRKLIYPFYASVSSFGKWANNSIDFTDY